MTTTIEASAVRTAGSWTLLASATGFLMISLDATIVNVALPTLGRDLHAGLARLQWVVDGYTLMFAGLLLTCGALGDRLGARRVYAGGLGLFVAASLACGLAVSPGMLVAARFVQGAGAAVMLPASLAMIRHAHPDPARRTRAIAIWAAAGGAAVAAGPVLGGLLIATLGWRSLFLVNLLIGTAGLAATVRAEATPPGAGRRLDLPGQGLSVFALCALTFGLIEGSWPALAAAAVSAVVFIGWERRAPEPMLPVRLFKDPAFASANAVGFGLNFAYYGIVFLLSLFLQGEQGHSALATGLMFLPMTATVTAANLYGGRLTARRGPRLPMAGGQLLFAAGLFGLLAAGSDTTMIWLAMVPIGIGGGVTVPAITSALLESVEPAYAGVASGALNGSRQVGGAVGVALFGTLVKDGFGAGLRLSLVVAACAAVLGATTAARWAPKGH